MSSPRECLAEGASGPESARAADTATRKQERKRRIVLEGDRADGVLRGSPEEVADMLGLLIKQIFADRADTGGSRGQMAVGLVEDVLIGV